MKARVKATYYTSAFNEGEIVEIIPNMEADAADVFNVPAGKCFLCKKEDGALKYIIATNLQLLASEDNPDYWTRLEHQYAGMAIQGMSEKFYKDYCDYCVGFGEMDIDEAKATMRDFADAMADICYYFAHALVEKYKKEERK